MTEKKIGGGGEFEPKRPNSGPKPVLCHFLKFGSLVFIEIAYDDGL